MTRRPGLRALAFALAVLAVLAAFAWQHLSYTPNSGPGVFDNPASFRAYVDGLGIGSISREQAMARLVREGFRCDEFTDGSVGCYRRVKGSQCGENQFVDLVATPTGGQRAPVSTRFGQVCR